MYDIWFKNTLTVGFCLGVYEPLSFKLGMLMGTAELLILILVLLTLILAEGQMVRRKTFCREVLSLKYLDVDELIFVEL